MCQEAVRSTSGLKNPSLHELESELIKFTTNTSNMSPSNLIQRDRQTVVSCYEDLVRFNCHTASLSFVPNKLDNNCSRYVLIENFWKMKSEPEWWRGAGESGGCVLRGARARPNAADLTHSTAVSIV